MGRDHSRAEDWPGETPPSFIIRLGEEPEAEPATGGADPDDVDGQLAYRLNWGRFGPPQGGTYHEDEGCWVLHRSDSDREVWVLPWPVEELEADDDWSGCGHCTSPQADESGERAGSSGASSADGREDVDEPERNSDAAEASEPAEDNHGGDEVFEDLHHEPADPAPQGSPALALEDLGIDVDDPWSTERQQEDPGDGDRLIEDEP